MASAVGVMRALLLLKRTGQAGTLLSLEIPVVGNNTAVVLVV